MPEKNQDVWQKIADKVQKFFALYPNFVLRSEALQVLRAAKKKIAIPAGNPSGWAGGIIYAAANDRRRPLGIPELLNSEAEEFFGVTMGTIRRRAARVSALIYA